MITRNVVLLGTSHTIQLAGIGTNIGVAFFYELKTICARHKTCALAEEMSQFAVTAANMEFTIPYAVARDCGLTHIYVDPDPKQRAILGIEESGFTKLKSFTQGITDEEITFQLKQADFKREQYWLRQLDELALWPLLFVCGANHVDSFSSLLVANHHSIEVAHSDWTFSPKRQNS